MLRSPRDNIVINNKMLSGKKRTIIDSRQTASCDEYYFI